jgi:CRISPR-associated protein Cmx8
MSKAKGKASAGPKLPDVLDLEWSLADLPSSQHRAGLAGLALMLDWLNRRPVVPDALREHVIEERRLRLRCNVIGLQSLFDAVYAAALVEKPETNLRKDRDKQVIEPRRIEERVELDKKGKEKKTKVYIYDQVEPGGAFLAEWDGSERKLWIKLWRDFVWQILRGVPAQRRPYEDRAEGVPGTEAVELWPDIAAAGAGKRVEQPSTYFLGAQQFNAEGVSFYDRARLQLLLHFAPLAFTIYQPEVLDPLDDKTEFKGFAAVVPDVANLKLYVELYPDVMRTRSPDAQGYRPRGSVVTLASESALAALAEIAARAGQAYAGLAVSDVVSGTDVFHLEKQGNNVRMLSSARVAPSLELLSSYAERRGRLWSPLFRRQWIVNLLHQKPWWTGFDRVCATAAYKTQTIGSAKFCHDCRALFSAHLEEVDQMSEDDVAKEKDLDAIIYALVRSYVRRRTESKTGLDWTSKDPRYEEARTKIAKDAFLAIRSRTASDFVDYFASTICSVPQFLPEAEFTLVADALRTRAADVRTVAMLALSAASYAKTQPKSAD